MQISACDLCNMFVVISVVYLTLFLSISEQCKPLQLVTYTLTDLNYDFFNITNQLIINGFNNYRVLSVNGQHIPALCPQVLQLQTVIQDSEVYINKCNVQYLEVGPYEFSSILNTLSITFNPIRQLTEGCLEGVKVRNLNLSYNSIEWIDAATFNNNPFLESVILKGNKLQIINSNWFFNTPYLHEVDLSYNKLWTLQAAAFKHLVNCSFMSFLLDHNRIARISGRFLKGFKYVTRVNLKKNCIASIPKDFLLNIMAYEVQLRGNQLTSLPVIFFQKYPQIIFLDLRDNRFSCQYLSAIKYYAAVKKQTVFGSWDMCYNLVDDEY